MSGQSPVSTQRSGDMHATAGDHSSIASDIKDSSREVAGAASRALEGTRESIADSYQTAKKTLTETQAAVSEKGAAAAGAIEHYVGKYPWAAVGAAIAIGAVLGALIRRR